MIAALILRARSFDATPPPALASIADTALTLPDGRTVPLRTLLRARTPTVISLWASWCGPCRREAPTIARLQQRAARGEINLLYLNVRDPEATRDNLNAVLTIMRLQRDGYAVLSDEAIGRVTNASGVAIPHTLLFDRDGHGLALVTGYNPLAQDRLVGMIDE